MRSFDVPTAIVVAGGMLLLWLALWLQRRLRRRGFISPVDQATYSDAAPCLARRPTPVDRSVVGGR